jgi:hypothetical protein
MIEGIKEEFQICTDNKKKEAILALFKEYLDYIMSITVFADQEDSSTLADHH